MRYPKTIAILGIILFSISGLAAQEIQYVSSFLWNQVNDIAMLNDTAWCAFDNGLVVIDFTDPANPVEIDRMYLPGQTYRIKIVGHYAYIAGVDEGMQIVDISNPAEPQLIYTLTETTNIYDLEIANDLAYISDGSKGLSIYHILNPYDPAYINSELQAGQDILIIGNRLYVASGNFRIYSLENPQAPELLGSIEFEWGCDIVAVQGNYAYIGTWGHGLSVYDISDPGTPVHCCDIPGSNNAISVSGDIACIATYGPEIKILDISDPYQVVQIASYQVDGICDVICLDDNIAYLANNWAGVEAVDLSVPSEPNRLGMMETPSRAVTFKIVDDILYADQLKIIDISDRENPELLGHLDIPIAYTELDTYADYVLLGGYDGLLYIVDVSNAAEPSIVSTYNAGFYIQDIKVNETYAYVSTYDSGIQILDISDPENPLHVSAYSITGTYFSDIYVQGNIAYLAVQGFGLEIVDISDPANPEFVSELPLSGNCHHVFVLDNYAYLTSTTAYHIVDISDILHPRQITAWGSQGTGRDIYSDGHYVYMANEDVWIIDISDLPNCYEVSRYITPGRTNQIYVDSSYIYVADRSSFMIFRFNPTGIDDDISGLPANFALMQNYPNPFNAHTEIRFDLRSSVSVQLSVYDILGRHIETLIDSRKPAGSYNIIWDAGDLPSGVYFYKLQAGDLTESRKCLLLK